jgi:hypothetical protein
MIWKQVDIVTMLEAAIDYVKYLQDQVKVNLFIILTPSLGHAQHDMIQNAMRDTNKPQVHSTRYSAQISCILCISFAIFPGMCFANLLLW